MREAELRNLWGPGNREKHRLNQTRPLPSKKPLFSEGREVLRKAGDARGTRTAQVPNIRTEVAN